MISVPGDVPAAYNALWQLLYASRLPPACPLRLETLDIVDVGTLLCPGVKPTRAESRACGW